MNLRGFAHLVRERYRLILVTLVATLATATVLSLVVPKTYEASATLIVGNATGTVTPSLDQTLVGQRLSQTYAAVATQRATLQRVIDRLKLDIDAEGLAKEVDAQAPTDRNLVQITVQARSADEAANIANAIAEDAIATTPALTGRNEETQSFIDASLSDVQAQIAAARARADELANLPVRTPEEDALLVSIQDRLANLETSYTQLLGLASSASANLATLSDPAVPPTRAASPSLVLNLLLGLIGGLLIGLALALAADHFDDSVKSPEEIEEAVGLATLGQIGRQRLTRGAQPFYLLATLLYPRSALAEAYRLLRTNIGFSSVDKPVHVVVVTSPLAGEGKTAVACNLAIAFAQAGRSTILVDADLRRPGVHAMFDLPAAPGVTNLLLDESLKVRDLLLPTEQADLRVLPMGDPAPNPAELVGTSRMAAVLAAVRREADLVVVDSPPVRLVADAALLALQADGTLVVVDAGRTPRAALVEATDTLGRAGVRVLGAVLNRVPGAPTTAYAAYGTIEAGPVGEPARSTSAGRPGEA